MIRTAVLLAALAPPASAAPVEESVLRAPVVHGPEQACIDVTVFGPAASVEAVRAASWADTTRWRATAAAPARAAVP